MDRTEQNTLPNIRSRHAGRLTIFVGVCPGSGKTFAMLRAAQQDLQAGRRVLLIDTAEQQDDETSELLAAFETYQPPSGSPELLEVLAKAPEQVVIENLGARNPIGSRNRFRWADVLEILEEGIDVYTTLAAWQVEKVAVEVEERTGLRPSEVVPAEALMLAHEIRPVVCDTDLVVRRLALRQSLSLLEKELVADLKGSGELFDFLLDQTASLSRTEDDVATEEAETAGRRLGMVCLGPTPAATQILRQAYEVSTRMKMRLVALVVEGGNPLAARSVGQQYLDEAIQLAHLYGVEVTVSTGRDVAAEIVRHAKDRKPQVVFLGSPGHNGRKSADKRGISAALANSAGAYSVYVIATDAVKRPALKSVLTEKQADSGWWAPFSFAVAMVALCSLIVVVLGEEVIPMPKLLIYVLGVMIVARRTGLGESVVAAVLGLAAFDLLIFREFASEMDRSVYYITMTTAAAVMAGTIFLQHGLKASIARARVREKHVSLLLGFTQEISDAGSLQELGQIAGDFIEHHMSAESGVTLFQDEGSIPLHRSKSLFELRPLEAEAAEEARSTGQITGASSIVMGNREGTYIPIADRDAIRGLLAIKCPEGESLDPNALSLLRSFAWQLALAFDRMMLAYEKEETSLKMERQQIQNTLLSSVSHDLRSPLTVIAGAAQTLASMEGEGNGDTTRELAHTIRDEADRLNQLVQNLLDITRLKSGQIKVRREWCSIEEVIGAALQIAERQVTERKYVNDVPYGLPLIRGDTVLLQQLVLNLVENAHKHTPPEGAIEICAQVEDDEMLIHVMDEGSGIEPGMEEKIFEKFERGGSQGLAQGSGLGLAICRAIAEVHDGSIVAKNRSVGGAEFIVRLPIEAQPELPGE